MTQQSSGFTGKLLPIEIFSIHPQTLLNNLFTLAMHQAEDLALQAQATSVIVLQLSPSSKQNQKHQKPPRNNTILPI